MNPRTDKQNASLHVFLRELVKVLNDAGLDMKAVLKPDVEIPWTEESAKNFLWRPIQEVMTDHESTTECSTTDYNAIHMVLSRHLGEKLGIQCPPWPSHFSQAQEFQERLYGKETTN